MSGSRRKVKLREVIQRSTETIETAPDKEYREITVKLWGKGVVQRGIASGMGMSSGRRFKAHEGQFIISRIDARNGATGIVPPELDGAVVTNDFPLFKLDQRQLEPSFLGWLSKTADFVDLCKRASEGTTNRVRLQEERFLDQEVALPSLKEQQRIVAGVEVLAAKLTEARRLRISAIEEAEAFVVSLHTQFAGKRTRKLGDLFRLDEEVIRIVPTGSYPQVGVRSFGGGLFPKGPTLGTETTYKSFNRLYSGALLLSQVKGWEGAVAICSNDLSGWFVSPEYRTFRCILTETCPEYMASLIRTKWFWGRLIDITRGIGDRRERTRPEQFLGLEIPMPTIEKQTQAVRVFEKIGSLKAIQSETTIELDAALPSILARAFSGMFK